MSWWEAVLDTIGILGVLTAFALVFLFGRRRWLSRSGGTFECSVRMHSPAGGHPTARGWTLGLGRYDGGALSWFRIFSFSPRPKYVFDRSIEVHEQRAPFGTEAFSLYSGHLVVRVGLADGRDIELAMSSGALTGLLAWLEAAPPGNERMLG
jgi:Protein of unknown function (DUF2550)